MSIGFLNVCTPQEEAEFNASEYQNFIDFFARGDQSVDLVEYRITEGELPPSPNAHAAYIISGSPTGVYDDAAWLPTLNRFIQDAFSTDKKLVGICFGHQMLAHSLGGHAAKSPKGWGVGLQTFHVNQHPSWMTEPQDQLKLYFCHQDQVETLPPNAVRLGGNAFCPNAMFTIDNQVLGIQGHPEFKPETMSFALDYLKPKLTSSVVEQANQTVNHHRDDKIVAEWIVNFIESPAD